MAMVSPLTSLFPGPTDTFTNSSHPGTVPTNMKEQIRCRIYWAQRWLNKKRGLPATPDVGILADVLGSLHKAMSSRLDNHVDHAVISRPDLIHLVTEDIEEAASLAGFTSQQTRHIAGRVTETSAAYAGSGRGLCKHYEDIEFCEDEEIYLPIHVAIRLTLTETALTGSCVWFQSAYFDFSSIDKFYFDLGAGNFSQDPPGWAERVQAAVFEIGSSCERFPDLLLVLGDHAAKPEFVKAVKAALRELLRSVADPGLHMLAASDVLDAEAETDDSTFLAARGAAEFARRASVGSSSRLGMGQFEIRNRELHNEAAPLPIRPLQHVLGGQDMA